MKEEILKNQLSEYPDILSVHQLKQFLGVGKHMVYELIRTHQIAGFKIGKSYKIPKQAVSDFLFRNNS